MYYFDESDIGYLNKLLMVNGELQVLPYSILSTIPQNHLSQFCVEQGIYLIPSTELIQFLIKLIGGRKVLEIGSGNGVLGRVLDIPATDNFMQEQENYRKSLLFLRQAPVTYGRNVLKIDANSAVKLYKPDVVLASWCTDKHNNAFYEEGEAEIFIDENDILKRVQTYIHVGNLKVHDRKPIQKIPHTSIFKHWLFSRSMSTDLNCIQIWGKV